MASSQLTHEDGSTVVKLGTGIETDHGEVDEFEVPSCNMPVAESIVERAIREERRIAIRASRLKVLQEIEKTMPSLIEKVTEDLKRAKLNALKEKDTPEAVKARVKKYVENHRDEINARRRERYAAAAAAAPQTPKTPPLSAPPSPESAPTSISSISSISEGSVIAFK